MQKYPQVLMRRINIDHVGGYDNTRCVRIRDEGNKTTMTYKQVWNWTTITGISEIEIEISDFEKTIAIFEWLGIPVRNYQETKREKRIIKTKTGEIELCIDLRPGCPEFLEIEWPNKEITESIATQLWFDIEVWFFGTADFMYEMLGICSRDELNHWKELKFDNYPLKK